MTTIQPFNLMSHYTGVGTSASPVTLNTPTYDTSYAPLSLSAQQSFTQWRPAKQTTAPDKRVIRSRYDMLVGCLITVRPTTATWQTRLTSISIAGSAWERPDHLHCVPGVPVPENRSTVASTSGGSYTALFPDGTVVPGVIMVMNSGGTTTLIIGNSDGVVRTNGIAGTFYLTTASGVFVSGFQSTGGFQPSTMTLNYAVVHQTTGGIDNNIWPQDTFTGWWCVTLAKNKDWMPPIAITASNTVEFTASMSLWMLGTQAFANVAGNPVVFGRTGFPKQNNTAVSPPLTPAQPFAFSRHRLLPAGLYWHKAASGVLTGQWDAVPGSSSTGFTPPITEPSCPFVITPGVPD